MHQEEKNNVVIYDTFKAPLHCTKAVNFVFNENAVSTSTRYYFLPDHQLRGKRITGIQANFYSFFFPGVNNVFPQFINVNGLSFNVIDIGDFQKIVVNLVDKENKFLLRRAPLAMFAKLNAFELPIFDLNLGIDGCYLEFLDSPLVTPLPMVIPFNFFWSEDN